VATRSAEDRATRNLIIWIACALCAGVWLGVTARIAMRFIALEAGMAPGFSSGGSLEVILFGAMIGMPIALLVWICRAKWRLPFWFGTFVGLALFLVLAVFQPPAARSALAGTPDKAWWTTVLFAAVFVLYGAVLDAIWALRKSRPKPFPASSGPLR